MVAIPLRRKPAAESRPLAPAMAERLALLDRLAERLSARATELGEFITSETGKPRRFSLAEARRTVEMIRAVAARRRRTPLDEPAGPALLRRRPIGTVAVVTPANNPLYIPLSKLTPAVAYGNRAIWKPAEEADLVSRRIMQLLTDAGWPDGLVRIRSGGREEAERLMHDPAVDAVTLTGSESAGRTARAVCSARSIPLQAELGGNNAALVWSDADLASAAPLVAAGAFEMAGQRCTANRRVVVHRRCRDRFLELLVQAARRLVWGDPTAPQTQIGPLLSPSRRDRVAASVDAVAARRAVLQPLGAAPPSISSFPGCWFPPTIVPCDDPRDEIVQEETFGPVLVVQTADDWEEAVELVNGVRQGLAAAVFSTSRAVVDRFLEQAQAGILKVNQATADAEVDVPFCAWKASGSGPPEHGVFNREFYTRPQTVYEAA